MKKLQKNFTTPEQSKRLLELGVPADSADMVYYPEYTENPIFNGCFRMSDTPRVLRAYENFSNSTHCDSDKFIELCSPCWSVGRLIEIYNLCCDRFPGMGLQLGFIPSGLQTFTDYIIQKFEYAKEDSLAYFEALNVEG